MPTQLASRHVMHPRIRIDKMDAGRVGDGALSCSFQAMQRQFLSVVAACALLGAAAHAHHSISAVYDDSQRTTIEGVVTQFQFVNPHPLVVVDVKDSAGNARQWRLEMDNRRGACRDRVYQRNPQAGRAPRGHRQPCPQAGAEPLYPQAGPAIGRLLVRAGRQQSKRFARPRQLPSTGRSSLTPMARPRFHRSRPNGLAHGVPSPWRRPHARRLRAPAGSRRTDSWPPARLSAPHLPTWRSGATSSSRCSQTPRRLKRSYWGATALLNPHVRVRSSSTTARSPRQAAVRLRRPCRDGASPCSTRRFPAARGRPSRPRCRSWSAATKMSSNRCRPLLELMGEHHHAYRRAGRRPNRQSLQSDLHRRHHS